MTVRVVVVLACIAIAIAGLKFASSVMAPVIFAGFLTLVSAPLVDTLHRKGLPRWLAISVTCLSVIVIGGVVFFTLYTSLSHFRDELPTYQAQMANRTSDIDSWLDDHGIDTSGANTLSAFNGESLGKIALKLIDFILASLSGFWFLFLLIIFFMIDSELLATRAQQQLSTVDRRWPAVRGFVRDLQKFFVIKSVENLLISGSMVVMLIIFDVPFPFLWGIIGFFMSYIPAVGLTLACIPPVLLAFVTNGATAAIVIAVGVTIVNQVGDHVILPLMANKRLSMPVSIQFVSFLLWTWVLGPVGAVLAIPLTMTVRLILSMSTQTVWLGDWLSGPALDPNEIEATVTPDTTTAVR